MDETSKLGKLIYNLIDAMFWVADETARWWNISKISIQVKTFRRQKAVLNKQIKENELNSIGVTVSQTAELASLNESISKLASKEDFLRSKCWTWTPLMYFLLILILFLYGVFSINPIQNVVDRHKTSMGVFGGQITRVRELPFDGHSIISDSIWFNNKLYVAGNNGITEIDTVSGKTENIKGLPEDFYAKNMQIVGNHLLIAGYSGFYKLVDNNIEPVFDENKTAKMLINSFALVNEKKNQYLIGTLGDGIYRSYGNKLIPIDKTSDYIGTSFGHQR